MYRLARALDRLSRSIEGAKRLDPVADTLSGWVSAIVPTGPVKDLASGTPTGHPLHPPLTALTAGALSGATILGLTGGDDRSTNRALAVGLLAALPTAYTGASDWSYTAGPERRIGLVHAAINDLAITCYLGSWLARRRGHRPLAVGLSLVGGGLLATAGHLGGHLAYALAVGVDTTAFEHLDLDWTDVAAESEVPATGVIGARAAGIPVLLARDAGSIVAMADRCTHRGGPLHEGPVADGCVECPWHGSRFRLADGSVQRGPAVRPQPLLQVRILDGRVQVRRSEQRSLRTRPVN